jgi:decaprenylphospho-beta-D-ribofuranose 2-oxidase
MSDDEAVSRSPALSAFTALLPGVRRGERDAVSDALTACVPDAGPAGPRDPLGCYSQMYATHPEVRTPPTLKALERLFEEARVSRRRVTLRAGGNAFDAQSLNEDLVVSLACFDDIGAPDAQDRITVGAGAKWGDILDKVAPLGLVPAVMVTTKQATAGGTLSGNCLSRFSPTFGKEGRWVRSFELLTIGGEHLTCTPPPDLEQPQTWTREERAFMAAIGGLGFVGAVHRITYQLVRVCDPPVPRGGLRLKTTLCKYDDYEHLAEHLVRDAQTMRDADPFAAGITLADDDADQAIYSALVRRVNARRPAAVVLTSTYTTERKRRPLVIHKPDSTLRFVSELILRTRMDWILTLVVFHLFLHPRKPYFDDLRNFTFFMDGNARVKAWGKKRGRWMPTVQQTFIVPFDPDQGAGEAAQRDRCRTLSRWLDEAGALMREHKVRPTFSDILFVNDTQHVGLSANAGKAGFAVSYAFETSNHERLERVKRMFAELADRLLAYEGRVYLVKNVYASQRTLAAMYGDNVIEFLKVKRQLDPERLLENDFLDRTFGRLADDVYAGRHD